VGTSFLEKHTSITFQNVECISEGSLLKASSSEADSDAGVTMVLPSSGNITLSGRQCISENIPTHEQLMAIKHKKKVSVDSLKVKC